MTEPASQPDDPRELPDTCPRRMLEMGPWDRTTGIDTPRGDLCPFCGSLTGEKFLELARSGAELGPTDKAYKVYLSPSGKFYFQHLNETQRLAFFDLFTKNQLTIGPPGHFYVLPYFITSSPRGACDNSDD